MAFIDDELAALKTFYLSWVRAGMPESYSHNGRSVTRPDMMKYAQRIDELETRIIRQTAGSFAVAQFRDAE